MEGGRRTPLSANPAARSATPTGHMFAPPADGGELRIAEFASAEQICPEAIEYFDRLYLPYTEYQPERDRPRGVSLSLPPYMTDEVADVMCSLIRPGDRVLAHTVGQIAFARSLGAAADASFRLNIFNGRCAQEIACMIDGGAAVMSPELNPSAMRDISRAAAGTGAVVYGKLPVMYTARCMLRGDSGEGCRGRGYGGQCGKVRESAPCRAQIVDRTGARFFVLGGRDCANVIYNSVPLWMADRWDTVLRTGASAHVYIFSDEDSGAVARVVRGYRDRAAAGFGVRRMK